MSLYYNSKNEEYIDIHYDEYAPSPRHFKESSTFITFERGYHSPDKNEFRDFKEMLKHFGTKFTDHMRNDLDALMKNALKKGYVVLPVWKYEHGNVSYKAAEHYPFANDGYVSTTPGYEGGWDGGLCGVIYEKRNRRNVAEIQQYLKDEVKEYSKWVNGEVLEARIYDKDGENIDDYAGYYVDEKEMLEDILAIKDYKLIAEYNYDLTEEIENHQEKIKNKPSLEDQLSNCSPDMAHNNIDKIKEKSL